jgi:serine/threonine protein kinase
MGAEDITVAPRKATSLRAGSDFRLPRPGEVVAEKYRIRRVLGRGGMGVVMEADHLLLSTPVALKFMHAHLLDKESARTRFAREARAVASLTSDHAVRILDVDRLAWGAPYIVMERLDGLSLHEIVNGRGAIPAREAVPWILQACHAIAEAHDRGIIHRDIKPENLFLTRVPRGEPIVKVLDFGLAKWLEVGDLGAATGVSKTLGSPQYISPEQIRSSRNVDARSDVWSIGATLYELLAGAPAFWAPHIQMVFDQVLHRGPVRLRERQPNVSPAIESIVMRCLERDPKARYQSIRELAAALAAALALETPRGHATTGSVTPLTMELHPPATEQWPPSTPWNTRYTLAALSGPALAVILACVAGLFVPGAAASEGGPATASVAHEPARALVTTSAKTIARSREARPRSSFARRPR